MSGQKRTPLQMLVERSTGRDLEQLIRDLFVERRHSDAEIAAVLSGRSGATIPRSTIQTWREQMGISREDRPPAEISL